MLFGKMLHGNRKIAQGEADLSAVVSVMFVFSLNYHDLPLLSASGHYRATSKLTQCNFK